MGTGRGGLYSYDWLDRLLGYTGAPSSDDILPQFQNLAVGDVDSTWTGSKLAGIVADRNASARRRPVPGAVSWAGLCRSSMPRRPG